MDNFFSSPRLSDDLDGHKINSCGTVRPNRNDMPRCAMIKDICYQAQRVCGQDYAYTSRQPVLPFSSPLKPRTFISWAVSSFLWVTWTRMDRSTNSVWASWDKILFRQGTRCHQRDPGRFSGNIYTYYDCIFCVAVNYCRILVLWMASYHYFLWDFVCSFSYVLSLCCYIILLCYWILCVFLCTLTFPHIYSHIYSGAKGKW
jgi:hypothetical protein